MARNHYEVLGVKKGSSQSEIKTAFRKLVIQYHPDTSKEPNALDVFHRITQAYEVLSDRERRGQYDRLIEIESRQAVVKPRQAAIPSEKPKVRAYAGATRGRAAAVSTEVTRLTLLHSRGQSSQAEKLAQKILGHDPRQPIPYAVLGDLSRSRGDLKHAAKMYAMAVQMDPGNDLYHQRHEEMVSVAVVKVSRRESASARQLSLMVGVAVVFLAAIYLVLAQEQALLPELAPISTWTLGVWVMMFLCGVVAGVSMCFAEMLDRFFSVATTALGKVSPVVALATIAVVNFWAAALIYALLGFAQNGFNYSTTRVVSATAGITLLLTVAAQFSPSLNALQVLVWGGNLTYMGALCGWMVADSMRR